MISETAETHTAAQAALPPEAATFPPPRPADEALFRQLVHDHQQRLYRFIVKHIGWGTDAEELTQQAFVEAAHSYSTFKGASELSTWLYRGQPTCHIDVEATLAHGAVMVRVTDHAPPFDPLQSRPPDTSADIDQRHIGGLGVLFARRLADELSYRLLDPSGPAQANEVRFVKRFRPQPPAGSVDA